MAPRTEREMKGRHWLGMMDVKLMYGMRPRGAATVLIKIYSLVYLRPTLVHT